MFFWGLRIPQISLKATFFYLRQDVAQIIFVIDIDGFAIMQ
jgi:hypothetical protein